MNQHEEAISRLQEATAELKRKENILRIAKLHLDELQASSPPLSEEILAPARLRVAEAELSVFKAKLCVAEANLRVAEAQTAAQAAQITKAQREVAELKAYVGKADWDVANLKLEVAKGGGNEGERRLNSLQEDIDVKRDDYRRLSGQLSLFVVRSQLLRTTCSTRNPLRLSVSVLLLS